MATKTNPEIAAAFDELADLYDSTARVLSRDRLPHGGQGRARRLRLDHGADPRGHRRRRCRASARRSRRSYVALDETGDIPSAVKLRAKFPAGLIAVMHLPGLRAQARPAALRRARIDSLEALRAAAEKSAIRELRRFGAKVEDNLLRTLAAQARRRRAGTRAILLSGRCLGRADRRRAARPPGRRPGRDRRLAAPDGGLGQGPRHHRHRERRVARSSRTLVGAGRSSSRSQPSGDAGARSSTHSACRST